MVFHPKAHRLGCTQYFILLKTFLGILESSSQPCLIPEYQKGQRTTIFNTSQPTMEQQVLGVYSSLSMW